MEVFPSFQFSQSIPHLEELANRGELKILEHLYEQFDQNFGQSCGPDTPFGPFETEKYFIRRRLLASVFPRLWRGGFIPRGSIDSAPRWLLPHYNEWAIRLELWYLADFETTEAIFETNGWLPHPIEVMDAIYSDRKNYNWSYASKLIARYSVMPDDDWESIIWRILFPWLLSGKCDDVEGIEALLPFAKVRFPFQVFKISENHLGFGDNSADEHSTSQFASSQCGCLPVGCLLEPSWSVSA